MYIIYTIFILYSYNLLYHSNCLSIIPRYLLRNLSLSRSQYACVQQPRLDYSTAIYNIMYQLLWNWRLCTSGKIYKVLLWIFFGNRLSHVISVLYTCQRVVKTVIASCLITKLGWWIIYYMPVNTHESECMLYFRNIDKSLIGKKKLFYRVL